MLGYSLRQLEYFVATAEAGSVAAAAARLNVAQPSVSSAIAKLEQQLSLQLFLRQHARGMRPTPAGRRILADARNLLRQARDLQQQALALGAPGTEQAIAGSLEVGCFVTLAPAYMPGLLSALAAAHPGIAVRLSEGIQHELVEGLRAGRFELAFLYLLDLPDDIEAELLATFRPYALLPAAHPLARRRRVSLAQLAHEPLILLDVPPSSGYFTGLFRARGLEPNVAFRSPSLEMVRGLVGRGRGYSILVTRPDGDRSYDGQALAVRPIAEDCHPGEICLARLAQAQPTRLTRSFADFCKSWFAAREAARRSRNTKT